MQHHRLHELTHDAIVRPMTAGDLDAVTRIDRDAFEHYRRQQGQLTRALTPRTAENMRTAVQRPYAGVVVEWPAGQVVGYCFAHTWGSVGWLGTLGVSPRSQGWGLGQAVISGGLDLLHEAGCSLLALETMPESGKNLAIYTRLGLEARQLTLLCQGSPQPAERATYRLWEADDALRLIGQRVLPGWDVTPAAQWLLAEDAGDTLVWEEAGQPLAFAVLRSAPRRRDFTQAYLTVEAAACLPEFPGGWSRWLAELGAYTRRTRKSGLILPVNARQQTLLHHALDDGMRIVHTRVRMATGAPLGAPDDLVMMTLAM